MMPLPEHRNPTGPGRTACAPYNFVPLPEKVVTVVADARDLPHHDTYADPKYPNTGYFEVTLTTKSPVYVRCPFTLIRFLLQERGEDGNLFRQQVKNTPDFFYTRDPNQPVIPGSSLRGMLRSVLEIVSYGKVQWVTDKRLFFRTVGSDSLGDAYGKRMTEGNGTDRDGYRSKAETGFLRKRSNEKWQIEKCGVARVRMESGAQEFGQPQRRNLCSGTGPGDTPLWDFQNKPVWVQCEPQPTEHLSRGRYLRYRDVTSLKTQVTHGHTRGTLVVTGPMQSKKRVFVFLPQQQPELIEVPNDPREEDINKRLIDRFHDDDQITQWQEKAFRRNEPTRDCRQRDGYLRDGEPVFFLRDSAGNLDFFGRAQMFRLPYRQRPLDLVPEPLRQPEDVDFADAIFGFTRTRKQLDSMRKRGVIATLPDQGDKRRAYAGRVCVTDTMSVSCEGSPWLSQNSITPRILATPKATAFQHYLTQQNPNDKNQLNHYDSPPPHNAVIRGHKQYWHQQDRTVNDIKESDPQWLQNGRVKDDSKQHTQFKPVKPGVQFKFRVYFENLSDEELGALCWTLHPLGDAGVMSDSNKGYCHSLGMGKPLGMGAVKLDATMHLTKRDTRYGTLFNGDQWQTGESVDEVKQLSDPTTLENLTKQFEQRLVGELQPDPPCCRLSSLKRIAMLLKMMEWPGNPAELPASPDNRPGNTRTMLIELQHNGQRVNEWKDRPVLPDPSDDQFSGVMTGVAKATAQPELPVATSPNNSTAMKPPPVPVTTDLPSVGQEIDALVRSSKTKEVLFDLGYSLPGKLVKRQLSEYGGENATRPLKLKQVVKTKVVNVDTVAKVIAVEVVST